MAEQAASASAEPMDATPFLPRGRAGKARLAEAVQDCRGCPLWRVRVVA